MTEHSSGTHTPGRAQQTVRVAALGFDQAMRQSLELLFTHRTRDALRLSEDDDADVYLYDTDTQSGRQLVRAHRELHPARPALLVSGTPHEQNEHRVIRKPISAHALISAIAAVTRGARRTAAANGKDTAVNVPEAPDNAAGAPAKARKRSMPTGQALYYEPAHFVLGEVLQALSDARKQERIAHLHCSNGLDIVLDPFADAVYTNASEAQLLQLGALTVHGADGIKTKIRLHNQKQLSMVIDPHAAAINTWPLDSFMWKLTLVTARGRVPVDTDLQKPVYIRQWPNLTRLEQTPEATRIIALWIRQPRSILSLFGTLMVPLEHILDVYGAACAIGVAGAGRRKSDQMEAPAPTEHAQRNIFVSLLRRLGEFARI